MKYTLPELPFTYDALSPLMSERTLRIHHDKLHRGYVDKLNEVLEPYPEFQMHVDELLASYQNLPVELADEVKKQGGGHANHTLFWTLLSPTKQQRPTGEFAKVLGDTFGSFENFERLFSEIAIMHFASGWAWLCTDAKGKPKIFSGSDHDNPIAKGLTPLLVLDLWEHAYFMDYENRRPEYVNAFWNFVNWPEVSARWDEFKTKGASTREWQLAS